MQVLHPRCCGIDVHQKLLVVCLRLQVGRRAKTEGRPVFNLLEGIFEVVLANPYHIKAVPGRKTDVKDCEWLADLLAHGLIRASFIPPPSIRELRDLTRYRK